MRHLHCLTAALALSAGLGAAQEPPNLVANPGFEEVTAQGFPVHWSGGEFGKPSQNLALDRVVAHSGRHSIRLGVSPNSFVTCQAANLPVKPQTKYCLAWWCKTDGLRQARAYLWLQSNQAQRVVPEADQFGNAPWTLHLSEYTTTAEETSLTPVATTHDMGGGPAFAWFDDIQVYEGRFPAQLQAQYDLLARRRAGLSQTALVFSRTAQLTLWGDTLASRIYAEDGLPSWAKPATQISLTAARNEEVFYQLSVIPSQDLSAVTLAAAPLKGPGKLPVAAVRWWPVGYVPVQSVHRQGTRLGPTPDPLLDPQPVTAPGGRNSTFCLGLRVPADARPGRYQGEVAIHAGGKTIARVPLALQVHDFALPRDPTFRTLITFSAGSFRPWDPRPLDQISRDICRVLHEHGIRGNGATMEVPAKLVDGKVVCDFTAFDAQLEWLINDLHFNAFFLGPMFGGGTSEGWQKHRQWLGMSPLEGDFNRLFGEYLKQVAAHLRAKGWLKMAYLYLWDEPEHDYFDKVVALQQVALQADPEFKVWETTSPSYEAFWGTVKAWSVPFGRPYFDEQAVAERRKLGEEIWVYNIPATLEAPPALHRLWFWMAARYGAMGAQLWQTTFYNKIDPWEDITPVPWVTGRDGKGRYVYDAGEAIMLYPNPSGRETPSRPGKPLSCLRLKLLQKGLDDFEYLHILEQRLVKDARARKVKDPPAYARAEVQRLTSQIIPDLGKYDFDAAKLETLRGQVAARIARLKP